MGVILGVLGVIGCVIGGFVGEGAEDNGGGGSHADPVTEKSHEHLRCENLLAILTPLARQLQACRIVQPSVSA